MNNATRDYLEKLNLPVSKDADLFYKHHEGTNGIKEKCEIIDCFGNLQPAKNLYMIRGRLFPKDKMLLNSTPYLTEDEYRKLIEEDKIKLINTGESSSYPNFILITSLVVCEHTIKKGVNSWEYVNPSDCYRLSEEYYDTDCYARKRYCVRETSGDYILESDSVELYNHYDPVHCDFDAMTYSDHYDKYVLDCDVVYPVDDPDSVWHTDDVHWIDDEAYADKEAAYENRIRDYHSTPDPYYYTKEDENDILSKCTIGFEVEKLDIDGLTQLGDAHEFQPLFRGWETDSSCGVEGITNVYSLNNLELFKNHAEQSHYLLEDSNSKCGGHINICDTTNTIKYWHIKSWCGLWWSMYRRRLRNDYSNNNKKACPYAAKGGARYSAIREKTITGDKTLYELRLPSRVKNTQQIIRRFELAQVWVKCLYEYAHEDWSYTLYTYDDTYYGIPNWATSISNDEYSLESEKLLLQIPKQIVKRMRYQIELSKKQLIESYPIQTELCHIIRLAYFFQYYCELPQYTMPEFVRKEINPFL